MVGVFVGAAYVWPIRYAHGASSGGACLSSSSSGIEENTAKFSISAVRGGTPSVHVGGLNYGQFDDPLRMNRYTCEVVAGIKEKIK